MRGRTFTNKIIIVSLCVSILVIISVLLLRYHTKMNSWVVKVNGEPVSKAEFKQEMILNRSYIYSYFKGKYGVEGSQEFWNTAYGGEVPLTILRQITLENLVETKIQQVMGKQESIIESTSYTDFLKALKIENERRKTAVKNGEVIYGPEQYQERVYFNYLFSNMVIELKKILWEKEFKIDDAVLKSLYDLKGDRYGLGEQRKVRVIQIPFTDESGRVDDDLIIKAERDIEEAANEIDNGTEFIFDGESSRRDYMDNERILIGKESEKLKEGEISGIIRTDTSFILIKCMERKCLGVTPFNEIKEIVKSEYIDEKYNELISRLASEASIELNDKIYNQIQPE